MKILMIAGILMLHHMAFADPGDVRSVPLETGVALRFEEIFNSRILPHAYYDQAISSIPGVYTGSKIIAGQRFFHLGKGDTASANAMICYKKDASKQAVTISGVSVSKGIAWHFETETPESVFPETLIAVIAELSKIPFNKLQPETPSTDRRP